MLVERIRAVTEGPGFFEVGPQGKMHGPHVFRRWPKSASQPPLFVLLQVPLWYACVDGTDMLVFTNIRIVSNVVGLLDGKNNMTALGLSFLLGTEGHTRFVCRKRTLLYVDEGDHFFLRLAAPRAIRQNEASFAVHRDVPDGPLVAHIVKAQKYCPVETLVAPEYKELLPDTFPELDEAVVCTAANVPAYPLRSTWTCTPLRIDPAADSLFAVSGELVGVQNTVVQSSTSNVHALQAQSLSHHLRTNTENAEGSRDVEDKGEETQPDEKADEALSAAHSEPQSTSSLKVTSIDIERLHRQFNHPSSAQLMSVLQNAEALSPVDLKALESIVRTLSCDFCTRRARRRTPARPVVAIQQALTPGQDLHLDVGHFRHPQIGPFKALVATDNLSLTPTIV
jgi:hypothetical protein